MADPTTDHRKRNVTLTLTPVEADHVYALLIAAMAEGNYYGNRAQYWKRHQRITDKLVRSLPDV
jgi:hypothetical protein